MGFLPSVLAQCSRGHIQEDVISGRSIDRLLALPCASAFIAGDWPVGVLECVFDLHRWEMALCTPPPPGPKAPPVQSDPFLARRSSPTGGLAWRDMESHSPPRSGHLPKGLPIPPYRISHLLVSGTMARPVCDDAASRVSVGRRLGRDLGGPWNLDGRTRREQTADTRRG